MLVTRDIYFIHQPGGPYKEKNVLEVLDSGGTQDRGHSFSQFGPTWAPFALTKG